MITQSAPIDAFLLDHAEKMVVIEARLRKVLAEAKLQRRLMRSAMRLSREVRGSVERDRDGPETTK